MSNCFLHLGGSQKVEFDKFQFLCQVLNHVCLAQSKQCVVRHNSVLCVECKQENLHKMNVKETKNPSEERAQVYRE
jgi:hypothetical protein